MRSEQELLDIVYQRAGALRRVRRNRAAIVLGLFAAVGVAAGVVTAGAMRDGDDRVLVAAPGAREGTTSSRPTDQSPAASGGRLEIPAIDVDVLFVEGVSQEALEGGPGRYPETALPGHLGNSAIAGHRTTHGAPFLQLDALQPGDEILITTSEGTFTYEMRETLTVEPSAFEVVGPTFWSNRWAQGPTSTLTLTTENPKFSSAERMVVGAELIGEPVSGAPNSTVGPPGAELAPG